MILLANVGYSKYQGVLITHVSQLDEVEHFSNGFEYIPKDMDDLAEVLLYNNNRMLPFIKLDHFFFNKDRGVYEWHDISHLNRILKGQKIVIVVDEPFWKIRMAAADGKLEAVTEIASNYANTQAIFTELKFQLSAMLMHTDSHAEFKIQKEEDPTKNIIFLHSADYVGFACYGNFNNCDGHSQMEYGQWVYSAIKDSGKKMMLVPGAWVLDASIDKSWQIDQLNEYFHVYNQYPEIFGGIGIFTWGSIPEQGITGARDIHEFGVEVERLMLLQKDSLMVHK